MVYNIEQPQKPRLNQYTWHQLGLFIIVIYCIINLFYFYVFLPSFQRLILKKILSFGQKIFPRKGPQ